MSKSILIERNETRHLNVKEQDEWFFMSNSGATLVINLIAHNPGAIGGGRLYINGISLDRLEEVRDKIDEFVKEQREKENRIWLEPDPDF